MDATDLFRSERDVLIEWRSDFLQARARFKWPSVSTFNWAVDWFDHLAERIPDQPALLVAGRGDEVAPVTFAQLAARSDALASWWYRVGIRRGDCVLLAMGNSPVIWQSVLAAMKLGAVTIPVSPQLSRTDLADRLARSGARHVVCDARSTARLNDVALPVTRLLVPERDEVVPKGWAVPDESPDEAAKAAFPRAETTLADPLLCYFTSGTTSSPKLVRHNHGYPIGHLATMYWIGLRPGDVHLNIAAPGWAKHLGSGMFAAFNAEATAVVDCSERFSAPRVLELLERLGVTTVCAPPTAWRKLINEDASPRSLHLREAVSAGERLSPELIARVRRVFGVPVRDGYGQTETAHLIGFSPGQVIKPGSFGRPMPGFDVELRGSGDGSSVAQPVLAGAPASGEMQVVVPPGGIGMMAGYDDASGSRGPDGERCHRTGDLARSDADGYLTYIGRLDDIFKASGYRVSPLELEDALLEHPAVAEVAVVPSPDGVRGLVPKAYVALAPGWKPERDTAALILLHARAALSPYKRVRKLTFCELPKTISGKVKRGELRDLDAQCHNAVTGSAQIPVEWHDHQFLT